MEYQLEFSPELFGNSMSSSFVTPLRYPGGKGRLGAWLAEVIRHNGLSNHWYVEPYAGGAGAAMYLLMNDHVEGIVINDADPAINAFWWALLNDTDKLVTLILDTPVTMDTWYQQKAVLDNANDHSKTNLGFATFFLNRTNRSGIIRGGVIGGKEQSGNYKLDARYKKEKLIDRIKKIATKRSQIELHQLDAMALLRDELPHHNRDHFVYLDPPYFNKAEQLYRNYYNPGDHKAIADIVNNLKLPWIVTYDNCEEIRNIYKWAKREEFSLHYSTHLARPVAKEILFYGNIELKSSPILKR